MLEETVKIKIKIKIKKYWPCYPKVAYVKTCILQMLLTPHAELKRY